MKTLNIALVAATLMTVAAPAFAADDALSYKDQQTNMFLSTGDTTYAHNAGLSDAQINAVKQAPVAHVSIGGADYDNN